MSCEITFLETIRIVGHLVTSAMISAGRRQDMRGYLTEFVVFPVVYHCRDCFLGLRAIAFIIVCVMGDVAFRVCMQRNKI